jgi:hypothetical protein
MRTKAGFRSSKHEAGNVLLECALALPLSLTLLVMALDITQYFLVQTPIVNEAFQLALDGAEFLPEPGRARIISRATNAMQQSNSTLSLLNPMTFQVSSDYDEVNGLLRVTTEGSPRAILLSGTGQLHSRNTMVAPLLARHVDSSGNALGFTNDPGCAAGYSAPGSCNGATPGGPRIVYNSNGTPISDDNSGIDDSDSDDDGDAVTPTVDESPAASEEEDGDTSLDDILSDQQKTAESSPTLVDVVALAKSKSKSVSEELSSPEEATEVSEKTTELEVELSPIGLAD